MSILIITSKTDITTDFVVRSLKSRHLSFYRLNTEEIGQSVQVAFDFSRSKFLVIDKALNRTIDLLTVKSVYFRRPEINNEVPGLSAGERNFVRSELLFVLEGLYKILQHAFWINTVEAIRNAENKIYQQLLARQIGFETPDSLVTNIPQYAKSFYLEHQSSCIIKPIKSGLVEGSDEHAVIFTNRVQIDQTNVERVAACPVYLQNLIHKKGDVRVTLVGRKVFGALIHSQDADDARTDWRKSAVPLKHTVLLLPNDVKEKCLALASSLKLNFAAIDFVLGQEDKYTFLEINPNGQWAWLEKQLNFKISDEITTLLADQAIN